MKPPMTTLTEADLEAASLEWLATTAWQVAHGPDTAPDTLGADRDALLPKLVSGEIKVDGGFLE